MDGPGKVSLEMMARTLLGCWCSTPIRTQRFRNIASRRMKNAFKAGEVSARDLAYLVDRVAVAENRGQIYGTQFIYTDKCEAMKPLPIVDEQHLDERRKSVGLTGMAEYIEDVRRMYCEPGSTNQ